MDVSRQVVRRTRRKKRETAEFKMGGGPRERLAKEYERGMKRNGENSPVFNRVLRSHGRGTAIEASRAYHPTWAGIYH